MKLKNANWSVISDIICVVYILLFVYAAANKLADLETFRLQLGRSPLLTAFADYVSVAVPVTEIIIALLLIFRSTRFVALLCSFSLMVMFTTYIIIILNFSSYIPCSCGGILEDMGWTEHLFFNLGFIFLALIGLIIKRRDKGQAGQMINAFFYAPKIFSTLLIVTTFLGIGTVSVLYLLSENQIHRNNGFVRRYPHRPVEEPRGVAIPFNSYYIAGLSNGEYYLGNNMAPRQLLKVDTLLQSIEPFSIQLEDSDRFPFSSVQIRIKEPYFYLSDGGVPVIYKGELADGRAKPFYTGHYAFSALEYMQNDRFALRHFDGNENVLAVLSLTPDIKTYTAPLLQTKTDGFFDTDGQLLFNEALKKIVYVYKYRNEYFTADMNLKNVQRNKTIDTLSQVTIHIGNEDGGRTRALAKVPEKLQLFSCTSGRYLFVKSDRLGKYEPEEALKNASIIDVYNLLQHTYEFSFYLYHYKNEPIRSFYVFGSTLVGFTEHYLVTYKLDQQRFDFSMYKE